MRNVLTEKALPRYRTFCKFLHHKELILAFCDYFWLCRAVTIPVCPQIWIPERRRATSQSTSSMWIFRTTMRKPHWAPFSSVISVNVWVSSSTKVSWMPCTWWHTATNFVIVMFMISVVNLALMIKMPPSKRNLPQSCFSNRINATVT